MISVDVRLLLLIALLLSAAALASVCGRLASPPQLASGEDVLSVAFGDVREVISRAAVEKADGYFHGGVDMDCADRGVGPAPAFDPWRWIVSRIRAPQVHRHLEGAGSVELLPWLWAAVRVDPHNAEAWAEAWYVARHQLRDRALADRVLAEAKRANPGSVEIAFTEGQALYDGGKGDLEAARRAFARAVALADTKCGGDVSRLSEREEEARRFAGNYLEHLKEGR